MTQKILKEWLAALESAVQDSTFVKATLTKPTPAADDLKSVDIRPILVKRELKLSFTYHHKTRDIVKNYPPRESAQRLLELLTQTFTAARLHTLAANLQLAKTANGYELLRHAPDATKAPSLSHDRTPNRLVATAGKPYLHALGITDAQGNVLKNSQDKYRQINKYIEILDGLIKQLPPSPRLRVADMGSGKGYLTFALYDHLTTTLKLNAEVTGVEYRPELVTLCNDIAKAGNMDGLKFVQGSIAGFDCSGTDVVIALHACDTATDDALHKAITAKAALIVVAPCCHKQVRRDMQPDLANNPLGALLKYGTYLERTAEMLTDGLRAQLLELNNYRTNLFEFISDAHTPKNVMIVATRQTTPLKPEAQSRLQTAYTTTKAQFGLPTHYLEDLLAKTSK